MTATTGARGPYAKTAEVRQKILDAALSVFAESGYRATTMKEIAERAGISQRGLVHHFKNKGDLLLEIVEHRDAQSAEMHADVDRPDIDYLLAVARDNTRHPGLVELHSTMSAESTSPEHPAHDHYRHRYDRFRVYLTGLFESMQARGDIAPSLEPEMLASMFIALSDGLQIQWLYRREAVDVERSLEQFLILVAPGLKLQNDAADVRPVVG